MNGANRIPSTDARPPSGMVFGVSSASMTVWSNVYTIDTWAQSAAAGHSVSGHPAARMGRGGYHVGTFAAVKVGDRLACYVKAPAQRWVGILEVTSPIFTDTETAVWGAAEDGTAHYPSRFATKPILVVDVEHGVPLAETIEVLAALVKHPTVVFRRSLTRMGSGDGDQLLELLSQAREPAPVALPKKRKPTLVKSAAAVTRAPEHADEPDLTETPTGTPHLGLVWRLVTLGRALGCEVWVAADEHGRTYDGQALAEITLGKFPPIGLDHDSTTVIRSIDVLWLKGKTVAAAFEVEATTSVYSGILRMSDLISLAPNTNIDLYIVAPDERREKVRREILRPTFEAFDPPLRERCRYLSASKLDELIQTSPQIMKHLSAQVVRDYAESMEPAEL
jgi:hypothetical protein